jgi:hypothetical protein
LDTVLSLLKIDLGITHNLRDAYLIPLIQGSKNEIERRGITLDLNNTADQMLLSDYSAWTYRKRLEDAPLANNIQARLRNRIIEERIAKQDAEL